MSLSDIQSMKALKMANQNASVTRSYAWNIDKGLRNWNAAKARASSNTGLASPTLLFLGDSITDAAGAAIDWNHGFPALYRNSIQLATGLAGHGWLGNHVFTPDNTWSTINLKGTNLNIWKGTPTSSQTTFLAGYKSIDVIYSTFPDGGSATITAEGGFNPVTINCNGAESYHNVATITVGSFGKHSVIVNPPASGNIYIEGFISHSDQSGLLVNAVGHPGIRAADYKNNQNSVIASTSAFNPMLSVIMLGTNDAGTQTPLADYQAGLDALVKQALTKGDVLVMSMGDRYDTASLTIPYSSYVTTAKQVAINNNCAYLSIYERWNKSYSWANNSGFMSADGIHPSQSGHTDIAQALYEILGGYPISGFMQLVYTSSLSYGSVQFGSNIPGTLYSSPRFGIGGFGTAPNVTVTQGATSVQVNMNEVDTTYTITVSPNWNTSWWITNKAYNGFTVNFGTPAPVNASIDAMAIPKY
jgi:lysophospholipase L1-like esterase